MNLSELKNLDLGALLKGVLNKNSSLKGPQAKMVLWGGFAALLFVAYIVFVFLPYLAEREQMAQKIAAIPEMEAKVKYLDVANKRAQEDLLQAEMNYLELNRLFSVDSELEDLYQRLSQMASSQGLVISALSTDGEEAIYAGGKTAPPGQAAAAPSAPAPAPGGSPASAPNAAANPPANATPLFYRIKLKVEMTGNYNRYMRYRKLLAGFEKTVNIDKEQIILVSGNTHGLVQVKSQLSTYRLPQKLQSKVAPQSSLQRTIHLALEAMISSAHAATATDSKTGLLKNEHVVVDPPSSEGGRVNDRDPFSKSSSGMIEGGRDPRYSPLLMADPQSYVIMGVVVSNSVKAAMIRTDFRESFVVRVGDRLGNQGGVIADIDMDGIILRQPNGKIRLYLQSQAGQFPGVDNSKGGAR
ncbi:hypothetical protein [Polynucleobacter necessarius]|uniref:hypothetical protein n=1 Tax=Polynucleobacter necessarius TaxID=576610 RepID=UPI000E097A26|nr:hypothetical protein [Polynucleobacter necessarius]